MRYIENVRQTLQGLPEEKRKQVVLEAKKLLVESKLVRKDKIRPSSINGYMENLINGKETNVKYLEVFLEALDNVFTLGGFIALVGRENLSNMISKNVSNVTWRDILLVITNDTPSPKLVSHTKNKFIIKEMKRLFITIVEACVVDDEGETMLRLKLMNEILSKKDE